MQISYLVIQFSGMGSDEKYVPGSGGGIQGSSLCHYKTELGPLNFSKLSEVEARDRISKLSDVDTIDGNGQIYLALQDISMKNFHSKLDSIVKGRGQSKNDLIFKKLYERVDFFTVRGPYFVHPYFERFSGSEITKLGAHCNQLLTLK